MDKDLEYLAEQLEIIKAVIGAALAGAQGKPEAIQILVGAISDLHPALTAIARDVQDAQWPAPLGWSGFILSS